MTMIGIEELRIRLRAERVIPVVAIDDPDHAVGLADALSAGGVSIAEITFRTPAAAEAIRTLRRDRPNFLVGAGTVTTPERYRIAADSGAAFTIAPNLSETVMDSAADAEVPHLPGVATPTEAYRAVELGCRLIKFFPAGSAGGVEALRAWSGPLADTPLEIIPTGGIGLDDLPDYLAASRVIAVGGSWLAPGDDIESAQWAEITGRARRAAAVVARNRTGDQVQRNNEESR